MAGGPCEPHLKAEHMAAPTKPANVKNTLALGAVHTWPIASFRCDAKFGRYWGPSEPSETHHRKLFGATYLHEPSQVHRLMGQMFSGSLQTTRR
jgi:hypothetical protein